MELNFRRGLTSYNINNYISVFLGGSNKWWSVPGLNITLLPVLFNLWFLSITCVGWWLSKYILLPCLTSKLTYLLPTWLSNMHFTIKWTKQNSWWLSSQHIFPQGKIIFPHTQTQNLGLILDSFHFLTFYVQDISPLFKNRFSICPFSISSLLIPSFE